MNTVVIPLQDGWIAQQTDTKHLEVQLQRNTCILGKPFCCSWIMNFYLKLHVSKSLVSDLQIAVYLHDRYVSVQFIKNGIYKSVGLGNSEGYLTSSMHF